MIPFRFSETEYDQGHGITLHLCYSKLEAAWVDTACAAKMTTLSVYTISESHKLAYFSDMFPRVTYK